jgi:hypothetical protein
MESLVASTEKHYTPIEVAEILSLHPKLIRDMFRKEPGVISIGTSKSTARKRAYATLRIPQSVLDRVHRRMQVKG